ncbi:hypothetical protein [Nocardia beijingensis]
MSSYLVVQLYCTPTEAEATRSALAAEIAKFPEFTGARITLEQKAETDYEMHLHWAAQHPDQDPGDRAYHLLRVDTDNDVPEPVLREAESNSPTGSTRPTTTTPTTSSSCNGAATREPSWRTEALPGPKGRYRTPVAALSA